MAGGPPLGHGEGSSFQLPAGQWTAPHPTVRASRSRPWLAIAVAVTAVVAVAALVVALMRPMAARPSTPTAPTYTPAETAAAQQHLCDTYKLAARAVQVDTNGNDKALARTATTNAAVMLENAATDPALDAKDRDAARALATAYLTATAKATNGVVADAEWQAALDEVIAKDAAMKKVCGVA